MNRLKRKLKRIQKVRNDINVLKRENKTKRLGIQIQKRQKNQMKILLKSSFFVTYTDVMSYTS